MADEKRPDPAPGKTDHPGPSQPQPEDTPQQGPENSSSDYTIILDKDLVNAGTPQITLTAEGHLSILIRLKPGEHTMDLRDPACGTPNPTEVVLKLIKG